MESSPATDDDWLAFAKSLTEGQHKKFRHTCGDGEPRIVNHKKEGWGFSCFRCDEKGWIPRPSESLTDKLARVRRVQATEASAQFNPAPPTPAEYQPALWPLDARVWLYKAGISNVEIIEQGIYWNSRIARVVIPVRNEAGECIYWQARTLDKTNPRKYINPRVDKSRLVAKYGTGNAVVLTEDLLSAYRVSRAGVEAWCLLGTKLSTYVATQLITVGKPVVIWLDPDSAGQTAASKIIKTLRAYGVRATNVVSERDPKLLSREDIKWMLSTHCGLHV